MAKAVACPAWQKTIYPPFQLGITLGIRESYARFTYKFLQAKRAQALCISQQTVKVQ